MPSGHTKGLAVALVMLCAAAIGAAASLAASGTKYPTAFTPKDQAAAKRAVLSKKDLGTGWKGGPTKPDLSGPSDPKCKGYDPEISDLLVTGAADATYNSNVASVDAGATVFQTQEMAELDWKRVVPGLLTCLRKALFTPAQMTAAHITIQRIPFPKLGAHTVAYRLLFDQKVDTGTIRGYLDIIVIVQGRTELKLTVTSLASMASTLKTEEQRYALLMTSRAAV